MKKLLFILIMIPFLLLSQKKEEELTFLKIDSLKKSILTEKRDTLRVKALFRIGALYNNLLKHYPEFNDSIDNYLWRSEVLSKKVKHTDVYAKKVLRFCIFVDLYGDKANRDAVRKIRLSFQAVKIFTELKDTVNMLTAYNNLIFLYNCIGDHEKTLQLSKKMFTLQQHDKDVNKLSYALQVIGDSYYQLSQNDSALYYYKLAFEKFKLLYTENSTEDILDRKVGLVNNICELYSEMKMYNKTLSFYKKNEDLFFQCSDTLENQLFEIVHSGRVIGTAYQCIKNYSMAISTFEKAVVRYQNSIDDYHRSWPEVADLFTQYGLTYQKMNAPTKAIEKFNLALKYAEDNYSIKAEIYKHLSASLQKTGNLAKALEVYKEFVNANDSSIIINNRENNIKQAALISSEFDFKNQIENEQFENQKQKSISEEKNQKQQLIIWTTISAIVVLIIVAFFILRTLLITRKQKKIIEIQKSEVEEKKHIIDEKHREITDSINYAERIQRSFLATKELLDENLKDYFVFFKPKDVVSGDFYWAHTLQNGNFALVTADSTGHGVPGAIMSLLNTSSLEKAIELGATEPSEILNHTRQTIIERLKKDGSAEGGKDGMDCSLISFNSNKTKLTYSAANNPIWIVRDNEMIELSPDKIPVGKHDRDSISFTQHEVNLQKGDIIYTLTDGFPDQFGGPKGKKFMYKKLKEILISIANLPMQKQQEFLQNTLEEWKGNTEQVDDITIIGIRI